MMAEDVLVLTIQDLQERKKPLPDSTTDYKKLLSMADPNFGPVAFVLPVTIYTDAPVIRISMTGPEDKLQQIKVFANACGKTRSAFMIEASMDYMAHMKADK